MLTTLLRPYRGALAHAPFRRFWVGFSVSVLGDTLSRVALTWFVYERTGSAQALGWLALCYTGPVVVGGLAAGWLLDRFGRRRVMLVDSLLRAAVMLLVPVLDLFGALQLWHVYLVAAVYGLLMMVPLAGGPALVASLVPDEHLATANALETLSFTLGGVIGPPLAGWLITRVGAPPVVLLDVLSYGVFAVLLARLGRQVTVGSALAGRPDTAAPVRLPHVVQLLVRQPALLATTLMFMAANIGVGAAFVWLPLLADQALGGGAALYGLLLGALAAGEVVSSVIAGGLVLPLPLGTLIALAQTLGGAALLLLLPARGSVAAAAVLALFGACLAPLTIWAQTLRMRLIPAAMRGRAFALLRTLMQGTGPLGGVLAGWALAALGLPVVIVLSALTIMLPGLAGLWVRALHRPAREG
jgi:predicted MFS family arabinose efflux permease